METSTLTFITNVATLVGVVVAAFALYRGYVEYRLQSMQKRYEHIKKIRDDAANNKSFQKIVAALEVGDASSFDGITFAERTAFLLFYEEVALSVNSQLINPELARHWYARHLVRCWENVDFWGPVDIADKKVWIIKDDPEWAALKLFYADMKNMDTGGNKKWRLTGLRKDKLRF